MTNRIGLVGLGLVGTAIAESLLAQQFPVVGFDTSPERCHQLEKSGGKSASSPAEVAASVERVILSLPDTNVVLQVVEGPRTRLRTGIGYGTIDCFRTQATLSAANFLGGGRRLDLAARLSKLGVGQPADLGLASSICSALSGDPFSERANYLTSATFTQPAFVSRHNTLSMTAFAERRSEYKAFERDGVGGSLAMAVSLARASLLTLTYRLTYGSTRADTVVFCIYFDRFGRRSCVGEWI